ncbi:MAG: ATP-binding protein [Candidatus Sericytochromatia bacterium]|nr:ATP-binding protein [Candidatus Sericytochromatia bacterium]
MTDAANNLPGAEPPRPEPPTAELVDQLRREALAQARARAELEQALQAGTVELVRVREEAASLRRQVARFDVPVDASLPGVAEAQQRSARVVEALPVAIAYLDRDLVCRWVNAAFVQMAGRPRAEMVGCSLPLLFPQAPTDVITTLKTLFTSGTSSAPVQLPIFQAGTSGAAAQHWDVLALPLLGEGDRPEGILLAIEVTARVEEGLAQAARIERLTELDRLKGDFLSMVSHELRTPLTAIAGYAEFLEEETNGSLTPQQRTYVQAIQAAEGRIRGMVDDLLDFARIEAGTFSLAVQPVDMVAVSRHALAVLLPAGEAGRVATTLTDCPPALRVMADPERLLQVLLNVVGNAIKFTPAGGRVSVTLEQRGAEALVAVHDTGIGIPASALSQVFDRFYQVDSTSTRARGGVGLGLAIAKSLVERQGGRMGVESEPGQGTSFWFRLPLAEAPTAAPAP